MERINKYNASLVDVIENDAAILIEKSQTLYLYLIFDTFFQDHNFIILLPNRLILCSIISLGIKINSSLNIKSLGTKITVVLGSFWV